MVETEKENNKSCKNIIKMLLKSKEKNSNTLSKISKRYDLDVYLKQNACNILRNENKQGFFYKSKRNDEMKQ